MRALPLSLTLLLASIPALANAATANRARQDVRQQAVHQVQHAAAAEQPWSLAMGAGLGMAPLYEGSRAYNLSPLPYLQGAWTSQSLGQFSLGNAGLGWTPLGNEQWQATLLLAPDSGRHETFSHSNLRGTDADRNHLAGMGAIHSTLEAGIALQYQVATLGFSLQAMQDVLERGHKGIWIDLGVARAFELTPRWNSSVNLQTRWADSDYMQSLFGVDDRQAANSGFARYAPGAGIKSVSLGGTLNYAVSDHWMLVMMLNGSELVGDAGRSPIVQQRFMLSSALGSAYRF